MKSHFVNGSQAWPLRCTEQEPVQIILGDVRSKLLDIPDETFHTCITSPPYWGMRDYGHEGQIGAEDDLQDYVKGLVSCFREVRRVLRSDGTFWLNIANTYTSGGRAWRDSDAKNKGRAMSYRPDSWYLRSDIIWHKPNCQPESVKDRVTVSHEYLFMFSKSESYYFDQDAIKETTADGKSKKNKRTVWAINTEPCKEAHFAVFPRALVRPCILAGSPKGGVVLDPFFGSGTVGVVAIETDRLCVGVEAKPDYVKIAKDRIVSANRPLLTECL